MSLRLTGLNAGFCACVYFSHFCSTPLQAFSAILKVMLHWTIERRFNERNKAVQCCNKSNNVATIRNNFATKLQRYVALKIVVANRPV